MKKNKNIIAIAVAAVIMSPMAAMANTVPDNVGNVTYMGNIVANSPMWQWTVNDYPGPSLDAKPSESTTANGVTTYKLAGQPFIAVSGYLPSMSGMSGPVPSTIGTHDITEFRDGTGSRIADIQALNEPQSVGFTISAVSTDASGAQAVGRLTLKATEIRGYRYASTAANNSSSRYARVYSANTSMFATTGGSCFVGSSGPALTMTGNGDAFIINGASPTVIAAYTDALDTADGRGQVRWTDLPSIPAERNRATVIGSNCSLPSLNVNGILPGNSDNKVQYAAAAHVVELTPTELAFTTPVQGAWNATLNVTAYQM